MRRAIRWLRSKCRDDGGVDDRLLQVFLEIARDVDDEIHLAARFSPPHVFADRLMDSFTLGYLSQYMFDRLGHLAGPEIQSEHGTDVAKGTLIGLFGSAIADEIVSEMLFRVADVRFQEGAVAGAFDARSRPRCTD